MSALARDIAAIVAAVASGSDCIRIGVIEAANTSIFVGVDIKDGSDECCRIALKNLFEGYDENARIALVLTECSPRNHGGAWAAAANRFCAENIAGVLVLEADRSGCDGSSEDFLARIPDALWEAGMPIFYDESGILFDYAKNSFVLDHDARLSFKDIEPLLESNELASIGKWAKGMFPVFDVTGTDAEIKYTKQISDHMLDQTARACRMILGPVNCWRASWGDGKWEDIETIMLLLELASPGATDPNALAFLNGVEYPEEVPFAIGLDRTSSKELAQIDSFCDNVVAVSKLIASTLKKYHVRFDPTYKDNFIISAEELHDLLEVFGVSHQIQALHAGVPFEDIAI